ncbi:putative signal peptidase complex catalytic subunit SEC11 [Xylona heveae TC161]|uniref:Signal peptidase complex catalytic subunit SEC11 n=1 Tax=Xylona heveae (strain CBS 132557 / TC161) TaxID=1328760 RepID=A0A165JNL6_XYLHT|nr:putative signal peptidase complex catalytic subunit SEC11 [Xylona heveae TC161]KZF26457.1 putative signal peptidase complex catalytic subunit SEC11 [Xylona heveae TC161]
MAVAGLSRRPPSHPMKNCWTFPLINVRRLLSGSLMVFLIPATAYMLWKAISLITDSSHPIVVVISESMEPAFKRGDILILWNRQSLVKVGDIPVCWLPGRSLPMVHRAISVINTSISYAPVKVIQQILTKGDNNEVDDIALYPPGQNWIYRHQIVGLVWGYIPLLGWVTIALNEYPWLKAIVMLTLVLGILLD